MLNSIANPTEETNYRTTIIEVRKLLLKEKAGTITQEDIMTHVHNIGKK